MLTFTGIISNSGDISLTNVVVLNDKPAPNTPVLGPVTLAPGAFVRFTNSYTTPLNNCGPWIDTLSATARSICGANVATNATATCASFTTPRIVVTKACPASPTAPGGLLVFSGTVSNSGDTTLTNVIVVNDKPTNNTPVFGPVILLPGEVRSFSGSYVTPQDSCGPFVDTLTATARSICGSNVSHQATASCQADPRPRLVVEKFCPTNPIPFKGLLVYSGYVSNAGNITLSNVWVYDDEPVSNTYVLGPITLAPNQWAPFTGSYNIGDDCCGPYADMVTAIATTKCFGTNIVRTRTAVCLGITFPGLQVTRTCPTGPAVVGQPVYFSGIYTNTGNVVLSNVVLVGNDGQVIGGCPGLSPGEYQEYTGSFLVTNCVNGFVTNIVTITGYDICNGAKVSGTATCIINCSNGTSTLVISPLLIENKFGIGFPSVQGKTYTVQYLNLLGLTHPYTWLNLTNVPGTGGPIVIQDVRTNQHRFYRVIQNP